MQIVAVGEILWDLLPSGRQLGGTTANFILHARGLGADARLVSRVGNDPLGTEAIAILRSRGIPTDTIQVDPDAPTGRVEVTVAAGGQPSYRIIEEVSWDRIEANEAARAAVAAADAVCFGTLAQRCERSRQAIQELLALAKPGCLRVFDVNLRPPFWTEAIIRESLALADVVKLNSDELELVAGLFGIPCTHPLAAISDLAKRFTFQTLSLTCGAKGSLLYVDGKFTGHSGVPVDVVDTVGAGDSYAAALTLGLLEGWPPETILDRASRVSAFVCSQPGATPMLPSGLW